MADRARATKLFAVAACGLIGGCVSPPSRLVDFSGVAALRPAAQPSTPPAKLLDFSGSGASRPSVQLAPIPESIPGFANNRSEVTPGFATTRSDPAIVQAIAITTLPAPSQPTIAPIDLAALQRLAAENSHALKQAAADVAAARGAAIQAGLHPNPTVGYQGDQIGSGHTAGQQGAFLSQTIVTHGKLDLAQAAALAEVTRTEAAFQQAEIDLAAQVLARFYAVLVSAEAVRITEEMTRTFDALAERHQKLLESGAAVERDEVAQARAIAATARGERAQAANRRTAAMKQLAALVGVSEVLQISGTAVNGPLPVYSFDPLQEQVLTLHPEVRAASAQVERARFQLELARRKPYPNVETNTYVQHDYQTRTGQFGLQVGVALPVFDGNEGNIAQAAAHLVRATHESGRVRLELSQRLADAYERYTTNRRMLDQYRNEILPEQLKAFDGVRKRYEQEQPGRVSFSGVVLAQQTLARTYADYLGVLGAAWQAIAELTRLSPPSASPAPAAAGQTDSWPEPSLRPLPPK